jgi:hypothetical protein
MDDDTVADKDLTPGGKAGMLMIHRVSYYILYYDEYVLFITFPLWACPDL